MIKKTLYTALIFSLLSCEDQYTEIHRYTKQFHLTKDYPIYLDASEILIDIQVTNPIQSNKPFKIVANHSYYFVGEKMKGIHVFKKNDDYQATPLCFIKCNHLKSFDVADNILYCNNFVDLLAIDVEHPLQAKILQREREYFNNHAYDNSLKAPSIGNHIYLIGYKQIVLYGVETETNPAPNFSEYDKLYSNIMVKEIPDTLQTAKPYVGFVNIENKVFTLGTTFYFPLALCSFDSGKLQITESEINAGYYSSPVSDLQYKGNVLYIISTNTALGFIRDNEAFIPNNYFSNGYIPFDMVAIKKFQYSHAVLSGRATIETFTYDYIRGYTYESILPSLGAACLLNVNDYILALGKQLTIYSTHLQNNPLETMMQYSNISGNSMLQDGNTLIVAGVEGLSFYDISNLWNIKKR